MPISVVRDVLLAYALLCTPNQPQDVLARTSMLCTQTRKTEFPLSNVKLQFIDSSYRMLPWHRVSDDGRMYDS